MGNGIIAYDISALMLLAVSGVYYLRTSQKSIVRDWVFNSIMVIGLLAGAADIVRVFLSANGLENLFVFHCASVIYSSGLCLIVLLYFMYIAEISDVWHLIFKHKIWAIIVLVPVFISLGITVCMFFIPNVLHNEELIGKLLNLGYGFILGTLIFYLLVNQTFIIKIKKYIGILQSLELSVPLVSLALSLIIQAVNDDQHVVVFAISINCLILITINRKAEEELDVTTGMHSYWMFARDMELKMKNGKEMGAILVNILNFEHAIRIAGYDDMLEMLKPLSSEITRVMKEYRGRFTCYYNGDGKFAVVLSKNHFEKINEIATSISKAINNNLKLEISDYALQINTCIVNIAEDISDLETLFMLISDIDLIDANGKILYASEITGTKEFTMKKEMSTILDRAIANNYFSVFYQPIYNVEKKRFASAEALIRLRDPKFGYISPGLFIPMAEKSGAIHAIGSFVIDEVCKFVASEDFESLKVDYIEINLSVMQCLRVDLAEEILNKALFYDIDPAKINLEITETASAYSQEKLRNNIFTLNKAGFTFSLDDFGTGYSNLMRITSLPLSIVKLDRTFVLLEESNNEFHTIISNIIKMLKDMGMHVLVEGIESEEMVNTFIELGVDEIQGFYFSRPLTRADYVRFIRKYLENGDN